METWRRCPSCYLLLAFDPWLPQIKAAALPPYAWGCASLFRLNTLAVQSGAFFCSTSTMISPVVSPLTCVALGIFSAALGAASSNSWPVGQAPPGPAPGQLAGTEAMHSSLGTEGKQVSRAGAAGVRGFCCPMTGRPWGTESSRMHPKDSHRLPYARPFAVRGGA